MTPAPLAPERTDGFWVGSIVMDCTNFERMLAFWSEALHYVPRDPSHGPDWAVLKDPTGRGPNVSIGRTPEGPLADYRIHLDLYADDPLAEVNRLIALGATVVRPPSSDHDFVTLADPDGNLFDVIDIHWPDDGSPWTFGRRPGSDPA
jgi:hypothetical protein